MLAIATSIANIKNREVRFSIAESDREKQEIGQFRLASYAMTHRYMLNELDERGFDAYDHHGKLYAIWIDGKVNATIRLCEMPFESTNFVSDQQMQAFLGNKYQSNYVEWSRLLINAENKAWRLLPAMLVYAGLHTLATTSYQYYFGYSKPIVKRLFRKFNIENDGMTFPIPHRGEHNYFLLKGNFLNDYQKLSDLSLTLPSY